RYYPYISPCRSFDVVNFLEAPRVNTTPSERSIFLQWTIQPCFKLTQLITGYLVDVSTKEGSKSVRVGPLATSKIITGLQPYTEYKIRVKAVPYGLWSDNKSIQTDIAVPQVIQSVVTLKTLSSNSISVTWKHPQNHSINGPLKGYRVTYTTNKGQSKNVDVGVVNTWNLTSLEKCTWYSVTVSVNNSKYIGPPSKNSTIRIGNGQVQDNSTNLRCPRIIEKLFRMGWGWWLKRQIDIIPSFY
ncbi:Down syndrome cell adhesion molecule, partial [Exaiptasia diaphana]